jgi:hypothetical protein
MLVWQYVALCPLAVPTGLLSWALQYERENEMWKGRGDSLIRFKRKTNFPAAATRSVLLFLTFIQRIGKVQYRSGFDYKAETKAVGAPNVHTDSEAQRASYFRE